MLQPCGAAYLPRYNTFTLGHVLLNTFHNMCPGVKTLLSIVQIALTQLNCTDLTL